MIARDAYVWGLPTVDMYRILRAFALDPGSPEFKAPLGQIAHTRRIGDPSDTTVVAMNVDTPYSWAWLDLRPGPVELHMPAHEADRYMSAMVADLYTYIVGYVSPRTSGPDGETVSIVGPHWQGSSGLRVLRCPTDLCVVLCRTQMFGPGDLENVWALQDRIRVTPTQAAPLPDLVPAVDVRQPPTPAFLTVLDWMLPLMPPLPEERQFRADLACMATHDVQRGLDEGYQDLLERMATVRSSAELFGSREHLAGDHLARAAGAYLGILGNAAQEYLGVGYPGTFEGPHTITFTDRPPVGAFWSITLYTEQQHLYDNPLSRYGISSRDVPKTGEFTITVSHDDPGTALWLPAPDAPYRLTFRTYLPGEAIRDGRWTAPAVVPVSGSATPDPGSSTG